MSIKEKIIQHKGKIIGAAAVVGIVGIAIATKGKSTGGKVVSIPTPMKNLTLPEEVIGLWDAFWMEKQLNGETYMNAIVDKVKVEDLGEFGKSLLKAGYSNGEVGLIVGQSVKK